MSMFYTINKTHIINDWDLFNRFMLSLSLKNYRLIKIIILFVVFRRRF
ncbi:hypothetical protein XSR1_400023 [Xenorhabdus szentirmaii DSM 16338]|uniref:Uncharacterized protein n=1 Tax=Xenorhabdus szentirmaii DSM 16338 TaxID=1427518 RepID=W1J405_9GAMM|nr:hypothetical protein XSR1_400023 [Xenorhabdus szentirmaii DSM 16338]